jgi:hypothetical protein
VVERLNLVCGHEDLDVATSVKAIKLVEEFQHGSLDLAFTADEDLYLAELSLVHQKYGKKRIGGHHLVPMASISSIKTMLGA